MVRGRREDTEIEGKQGRKDKVRKGRVIVQRAAHVRPSFAIEKKEALPLLLDCTSHNGSFHVVHFSHHLLRCYQVWIHILSVVAISNGQSRLG